MSVREIALPAEVWSPLVSYSPLYILDENGIVQHEPLAKLLREKASTRTGGSSANRGARDWCSGRANPTRTGEVLMCSVSQSIPPSHVARHTAQS